MLQNPVINNRIKSHSPVSLAHELNSLTSVKQMHTQIIKSGNYWDSGTMGKNLITSYLEFGDFSSASTVFFAGFAHNYLLWNSFVDEFITYGGNAYEILEVFNDLNSKGIIFDSKILTLVLKMCANLGYVWVGVEIHACAVKRGFDGDVYLKHALMNYYGKCWGIETADKLFNEMPKGEALLWNEAVMQNLENNRLEKALKLFSEMQFSFVKAKTFTIAKILKACGQLKAFDEGKQIHGYVLKFALESDLSISNSLISMYSKNNKLELARRVFDTMENRNISSWNSIISGYASLGYFNDVQNLFEKMNYSKIETDIITWNSFLSGHFRHGSYLEVLFILQRMQAEGFRPNSSSIISVLQAITELCFLNLGKEIHAYIIRNGLHYDLFVGTAVLDMYVKNDDLIYAQRVFNNMYNKNIFAWNSLICGYCFKGQFEEALVLLNRMENEGIEPDLVTWNSFISGYSIWDCVDEAWAVIHKIKTMGLSPNVVSYTALMSGCSQNQKHKVCFQIFNQMLEEGVKPNAATISSLLRACAGLSLLHEGEEIQCLCIRNGFIEDVYVATALIDMYSKAGSIKNAKDVFKNVWNKTLATWNCMIMGVALYGHGKEAISLFNEMLKAGFKPDSITFTALLSGCKNSGLIDDGWKYFESMKNDYSINPTIEHYSCMVDLLGKGGYLDEVWDFIQTMPLEPASTIWGSLLGSCRLHKNLDLAEIAAKNLFELEPYNAANYVIMMGLYANSNRWEDVECIKEKMAVFGVKDGQTWSWIEVDRRVHVFSDEKKPHPDEGEIYFELYQLVSEIKKMGYRPDLNCVHQNIDEKEKEKALASHTEKLAITYGLMKMKNKAPIRVIKNSRICSDCHKVAKYISRIRSREIFLKDGARFHHFKNGVCSCNDCW